MRVGVRTIVCEFAPRAHVGRFVEFVRAMYVRRLFLESESVQGTIVVSCKSAAFVL